MIKVLKRFPTKTKYFLNCTKHVRWISAFWVFAVAYNFIIHPIIKSFIQITTRASVDNRNAIPLYRAIPSIYNHKMSHRSVICNQQHAYQLANQSAKIEDLVTHFINWAHRMLCDDKIQRKITKMQIKYTTSKSKSFSWIYKKQYKIQKWNPAGDQCMRYTQCQDVTITVRVLHVLFYACNWPIIMKQIWQIWSHGMLGRRTAGHRYKQQQKRRVYPWKPSILIVIYLFAKRSRLICMMRMEWLWMIAVDSNRCASSQNNIISCRGWKTPFNLPNSNLHR